MNPVIRDIAIELGFPPYQVRKWKLRNGVPHKHRYPILEAAQKRGDELAFSDFDFAPAKCRKARKAKPAPKKRRAA